MSGDNKSNFPFSLSSYDRIEHILGAAFKKYVSKQEISIGRCPTNASLLPDLKTPIAFILSLFFSSVSFRHQILSNRWYPNVFVKHDVRE